MATVELRPKGQITLPVEIREALHLKTGEKFAVSREGGRIVLERQMDIVERLSGIFDDYIQGDVPEFDREEVWVEMAEESLTKPETEGSADGSGL